MATWTCATHGPVPAGEIRHLDHNSPTGQERHECGSSAGLDWTKKEHDMTDDQTYGDFIVTRRQALVIQAPDITCMTVELLRSIDSAYINGDRIHVGEDEQGEPVTYQITGWDAARVALVLKRIRR